MHVALRNLARSFGPNPALQGVSLEIPSGELCCVVGPSGCGKTTLLRILAGLETADAGELFFGGRPMHGVPAHERAVGMVFQEPALWPHLTVAQNIGYGLEARGLPDLERRRRVTESLAQVRLPHAAHRRPSELSGGEQQRVALARALSTRPQLLLLDEPLSHLDTRLRQELREEIRRIHQETGLTVLYVTHDQEEALELAGLLVVLRAGIVQQAGPPRELFTRPANRFVADALGETHWLPGRVVSRSASDPWSPCASPSSSAAGPGTGPVSQAAMNNPVINPVINHEMRLTTSAGVLQVTARESLREGQRVWVGFRPGSVQVGANDANTLAATVESRRPQGGWERLTLTLPGGGRIIATLPPHAVPPEETVPAPLTVHVRPQDLLLLPDSSVPELP